MPLRGRTRRPFVVLAVASALAGACGSRRPERLVLGTVPLPAVGLVFIAASKGYFAAHGLDVEQRRFTSGRDALAALERGEVDAAVAYETPVILGAVQDPGLHILTTLHSSSRSTRVVARADRGVLRDRDLSGKRIGVPRNTNAESFVHALLDYAGVPKASVQLVDVAPERAAELLAAGELDAIAIWPPHAERARHLLGPDRVVELSTDVYTEMTMLVTRDPVLAGKRSALVKLVAALADAERLARARPEEAFDALAAALPDVPVPDLREAWGRVRPALGLSHLLAYVLDIEWSWLRAEERLSGPLDLATTLEPGILAEIDPESVTFVLPSRAGGR
jgi:ABC-type nitrate/sulfonate/bicarbonate transport system substrate-binding protein